MISWQRKGKRRTAEITTHTCPRALKPTPDMPRLFLLLFCSYANRLAWFISAYAQGFSGAQAVWANKKYHDGQSTLPHDFVVGNLLLSRSLSKCNSQLVKYF